MTDTVGAMPAVQLFGGCRVLVGAATVEIGGRKPRAVLARLAWDAGRVVPSDTLIGDVWGDDAPPGLRASLQMHITTLRRALDAAGAPEVLWTRAPGYVLHIPRPSVDVLRFGDLVAAATAPDTAPGDRRTLAEEALRLWDTPLLDGLLDAPFAQRIERWCVRRRNDLIVAAAAVTDSPMDAARLLAVVEPIADDQPLDVPLNVARASLLHASGRTREALASIARLRSTVREETGLAAGPAVDALERLILEHSCDDRQAPPPDPAGRTGDDDRSRIQRALAVGRVVTVCGPLGSRAGPAVRAVVEHVEGAGARVHEVELAHVASRERRPTPAAEQELHVVDLTGAASTDPDELRAALAALAELQVLCHAFVPAGVDEEQVIQLHDDADDGRDLDAIRTAIDHRIDEPVRSLLIAAGQLTGRFDDGDAHHLWERPRPDRSTTTAALEQLAACGLIDLDRRHIHPYRVPASVRRAVLESPRSTTVVRERVARALASRARLEAARVGTVGEAMATEWFGSGIADIERLALDVAIRPATRRNLAAAAVHWLLASGRAASARSLLAGAGLDPVRSPRDLRAVATTASALDDYETVDECHRRSLATFAHPDAELVVMRVRTLRHRCEFRLGHELLGGLVTNDQIVRAIVAMERGALLAMEARTDPARRQFAEARRIFEGLAAERAVGFCWAYDGWCELADGRIAAAAAGLDRAAGIAARLAHRADQAFMAVLDGHRRRLTGRLDDARDLATEATDFFLGAGDRLGLVRALELTTCIDGINGPAAERAAALRAQLGAPRSPLEVLVLARTA